jgi:hypothetical protein
VGQGHHLARHESGALAPEGTQAPVQTHAPDPQNPTYGLPTASEEPQPDQWCAGIKGRLFRSLDELRAAHERYDR